MFEPTEVFEAVLLCFSKRVCVFVHTHSCSPQPNQHPGSLLDQNKAIPKLAPAPSPGQRQTFKVCAQACPSQFLCTKQMRKRHTYIYIYICINMCIYIYIILIIYALYICFVWVGYLYVVHICIHIHMSAPCGPGRVDNPNT